MYSILVVWQQQPLALLPQQQGQLIGGNGSGCYATGSWAAAVDS
jgi:hypothetical protein